MHNSQMVLVYVALAVILLSFAATFAKGLSAYSSVFGSTKFGYKYDRTKKPLVTQVALITGVLSFIFGAVVAGSLTDAVVFALIVTFPVGLSSALLMAYVPKK